MVDLAENALTVVSTAEAALGISSGAGGDNLANAINQASQIIEEALNRKLFYAAAIAERSASYNLDFLRIRRPPIKALTSIFYDDSATAEDLTDLFLTDEDKEEGFIRRANGWGWTAQAIERITTEKMPGTEQHLWRITYDGGWVTPNQVGSVGALARDLPASIEAACLELVRFFWNLIGRDPSVTSERLLSYSVTFLGESGRVGAELDMEKFPIFRQVLRQHRRPWSIS